MQEVELTDSECCLLFFLFSHIVLELRKLSRNKQQKKVIAATCKTNMFTIPVCLNFFLKIFISATQIAEL